MFEKWQKPSNKDKIWGQAESAPPGSPGSRAWLLFFVAAKIAA